MSGMTIEQALACIDSWSKRFDGLSRSEIRQALATLRAELDGLREKLADCREINHRLVQRQCQADDEIARLRGDAVRYQTAIARHPLAFQRLVTGTVAPGPITRKDLIDAALDSLAAKGERHEP